VSVFSQPTRSGPACGCIGCHEEADVVIDHPEHGHRTVCDDHAAGHEVVDDDV
jgi:hypothetical protein